MNVYSGHEGSVKVCCSCDHRIADKDHCDIDGHYIGYLSCFDCWCRRYANKEYKEMFDKNGINKEISEKYKEKT